MGVPRRFSITNDGLSCTLKRPHDVCRFPQPGWLVVTTIELCPSSSLNERAFCGTRSHDIVS